VSNFLYYVAFTGNDFITLTFSTIQWRSRDLIIRRLGSVQSLCPCVQVPTWHCTWIPVITLPTRVYRSWFPATALSWLWPTEPLMYQFGQVCGIDVCLHWSNNLEQTSWRSQKHQLSITTLRRPSFPTGILSTFEELYEIALHTFTAIIYYYHHYYYYNTSEIE